MGFFDGVLDELDSEAPTPPTLHDAAPDPAAAMFESVSSQFPIFRQYNPKILMGTKKEGDPRGLELWPDDEPGSDDYPRPKALPLGEFGIEIFDPKTQPKDVMADFVSHFLINKDERVKGHYDKFIQSMTPKQKKILTEQYDYSKKNYGEKRNFKEWSTASGLPAWFRGYAFGQWDRPGEMYTPEQISDFDAMLRYLRGAEK